MIYATRTRMLFEFKNSKELDEENANIFKGFGSNQELYRRVDPQFARNWVKRGYPHSTGLYVDGHNVRYASAES